MAELRHFNSKTHAQKLRFLGSAGGAESPPSRDSLIWVPGRPRARPRLLKYRISFLGAL